MTSETLVQHTPGSWLRDGTTVYALVPDPEDGRLINRWHATVQRDNGERGQCSPGEAEAVALVMQAAPDLLAALEALLRNRYDRDAKAAYQPEWDQARRAIRRARGED